MLTRLCIILQFLQLQKTNISLGYLFLFLPLSYSMGKTAITLAPPTVGRQSADKMPDFSSFFIGQQKINYNYLVIIFFPSADSFGALAIGR